MGLKSLWEFFVGGGGGGSVGCIKPRKLDELKLTAANILGSKPHLQVLSNLHCVLHTLITSNNWTGQTYLQIF